MSGDHMPIVRLAFCDSGWKTLALIKETGNAEKFPPLLVSYAYLKPFLKRYQELAYRDFVLDSGAFSAHNSGMEICISKYIDTVKQLNDMNINLTEVFALDVIGNWRETIKNAEIMWKNNIQAIPCFHHGSPESVLTGIAKDYPKIALGGCVGKPDKLKFAEQCFSRVWPKPIHGFGFGSENNILKLPWHSVDASNWAYQPQKFGLWKMYGRMSVRCSNLDLRVQVDWHLNIERKSNAVWRKEMQMLDEIMRKNA